MRTGSGANCRRVSANQSWGRTPDLYFQFHVIVDVAVHKNKEELSENTRSVAGGFVDRNGDHRWIGEDRWKIDHFDIELRTLCIRLFRGGVPGRGIVVGSNEDTVGGFLALSIEGGNWIVLVDDGDRRGTDQRRIDQDTDVKHKMEILNLGMQTAGENDVADEDIATACNGHIAKDDVWEINW